MKPAIIFALVIRLLGLLFLYHAVTILATLLGAGISGRLVLTAIAYGGAAVWCFFGAQPIQQWAYPETPSQPSMNQSGITSPFAGPTRQCVSCGKSIPMDVKQCPHCGWTQPT